MSLRLVCRSVLIIACLVWTVPSVAQIPPMVNCQGILVDDLGVPLPGPVPVIFAIWNLPTAGDSLWSELVDVFPDDQGRFNVILGEFSPIPDTAFNAGAFLSIGVLGFPEMVPRQYLVSVPHAYRAGWAELSAVAELSLVAAPWSVNTDAIIDGTIGFGDIGPNGAGVGQVMKWNGSQWVPDIDQVGGGDNDWTLNGNVLYTGNNWGIARSGSVLHGDWDSTHVNLGVASSTGEPGSDVTYATVGGGMQNEASGNSATVSGGYINVATSAGATVSGGINNSATKTGAVVGGGGSNTASGLDATVAGGNVNEAGGDFSTVGGGMVNNATDTNSTVSGGRNNQATRRGATVSGGMSNYARGRFSVVAGGGGNGITDSNSALGDWSAIGGGSSNTANGDGAVVGGGAANASDDQYTTIGGGAFNTVNREWGTIGGGMGNLASQTAATVGGGQNNAAIYPYCTVGGGVGDTASGEVATISGGGDNLASGDYSFIGGGSYNRVRGKYSVIAGGGGTDPVDSNSALGDWSAIPGGRGNVASGNYSLAVGRRAQAVHSGSFVWADSTDADFPSISPNEFAISAANGLRVEANNSSYVALFENSGVGDCIRAYSSVSLGNSWGTVYAVNFGSSPTISAWSGTGLAGYFGGDVTVSGTMTAGTKSFKIDHPLDPENKYLNHSCVESPEMMNVYNGNVTTDGNGEAIVQLPEYFSALCKDFRYQLTVIGEFAQAIVSEEIDGNEFAIKTDKPSIKVSWQVTGVRQDALAKARVVPVEELKPASERGKYLHPEAWDMPVTMGVNYQPKDKGANLIGNQR